MKEHKFQGLHYTESKRGTFFYTTNLVPGTQVYDEVLVQEDGVEYRQWNPAKSKLGAALVKGISQLGIYPGQVVLYLGASTGTTPSHVSDLVGPEGFVFALDFAPRTTRDLVFLCEQRKNMCPILGDARFPDTFASRVCAADTVFMDIAQKDQAEIFLRNCKLFLKKGGFGILAVKARSIDVAKSSRQIFSEVRDKLEKEITIVDYRELAPFEKDHCIFVCKKK